jgi:hypothetical protein
MFEDDLPALGGRSLQTFHGGQADESPLALPGRAGRANEVTLSRPASGQDGCG